MSNMSEIFDEAEETMAKLKAAERAEAEWTAFQIANLLAAIENLTNEADVSLDMRPSFRRAISDAHSVVCEVKYRMGSASKQRIADCVGSLERMEG